MATHEDNLQAIDDLGEGIERLASARDGWLKKYEDLRSMALAHVRAAEEADGDRAVATYAALCTELGVVAFAGPRQFGVEPAQPQQIETRPPVQYVLVRKDLPFWTQAVFVGHAARESCRRVEQCLDRRTVMRVLHVADLRELHDYRARIVAKGFEAHLVVETDGPFAGQALVLGVEPLTERVSALSKVVFHLKRAGEGENV